MIVVLKKQATEKDAEEILAQIKSTGLQPLHLPGKERVVLGAIGDERLLGKLHLESHPMVESVKPILSPYKLVSREVRADDTIVKIGDIPIGGTGVAVIAGPCAIEHARGFEEIAQIVKMRGAAVLRGGAFKPRSSPYSFQGLGIEGLKIMSAVSKKVGIPTVTEVVEVADVEAVHEHADAFQVGARNMQNFRLLKALGSSDKPVILKRGMACTIEDLLLAAEYIIAQGNEQVILCERGIRTFEKETRNTLDLNAVPVIKKKSHLPVIVDPSHGTGIRELVIPMSKAAIACGADGIVVEVHPNPLEALSDGAQSLFPDQFEQLMNELEPFVKATGRTLVTTKKQG